MPPLLLGEKMKKNQLLGLVFIILAVVLLLQQFNMLPYVPFTKMVLIVLLGWYLVNSLLKVEFLGTIIGFVGLLFALEGVLYASLPIAKEAIIIIAGCFYIGLTLLFQKR